MDVIVKELRKKLGLTQQQLADKLGVVGYTVRRWEAGKSNPLPVFQEKLEKLAKSVKTTEAQGE